jgi:cyanate lyase
MLSEHTNLVNLLAEIAEKYADGNISPIEYEIEVEKSDEYF